jgi:hypothetical protein
MTTKTCTKCRRDLPATPENFHRDKKAPDGLHASCKPCRPRQRQPTPTAEAAARSAALELLAERHESQFNRLLHAELVRRGLREPGDVRWWNAA